MKKDKKQSLRGQRSEVNEGILAQAEELLKRIGEAEALVGIENQKMAAEIEAIKEKYDSLNYWGRITEGLKKGLVTLMKQNKGEIFDGTDQVDLEHGILLHGKEDKVSIPRDAVEKIEALGWGEKAIIIAKSVDRAIVEKWPVEKLTLIGAKKKPVETFEYEIKAQGAGHKAQGEECKSQG